MEADFYVDLSGNRVPFSGGRDELPTVYSIERGLIQFGCKSALHFYVARKPVGTHDELQNYISALFAPSGFFWILRIR